MRERLSIWGRSPDRRQDAGVISQEINMAKAANANSVAESRRGPNFKAALSILRTDMPSKKERIQKLNGEIAEQWGRVGGYHVDKVGAKLFVVLDTLDEPERLVAFRTLMGLIRVSDWPVLESDLADRADGVVLDPREQSEGSKQAEKLVDQVANAVDEVKGKPSTTDKPKGVAAAKAAAKRHLQAVPDPVPNADPDADLAGED